MSYLDDSVLVLKDAAYHPEFGLNLENDSPVNFNLI